MSKKTDLELLLECVSVLEERRRAVLGDEEAVVCAIDGDVTNEMLMHGDIVDALDLDKFARLAGFLHCRTMETALEEVPGYTVLGGVVGLVEESVLIGVLWERRRREMVRSGEMNPKVCDDVV